MSSNSTNEISRFCVTRRGKMDGKGDTVILSRSLGMDKPELTQHIDEMFKANNQNDCTVTISLQNGEASSFIVDDAGVDWKSTTGGDGKYLMEQLTRTRQTYIPGSDHTEKTLWYLRRAKQQDITNALKGAPYYLPEDPQYNWYIRFSSINDMEAPVRQLVRDANRGTITIGRGHDTASDFEVWKNEKLLTRINQADLHYYLSGNDVVEPLEGTYFFSINGQDTKNQSDRETMKELKKALWPNMKNWKNDIGSVTSAWAESQGEEAMSPTRRIDYTQKPVEGAEVVATVTGKSTVHGRAEILSVTSFKTTQQLVERVEKMFQLEHQRHPGQRIHEVLFRKLTDKEKMLCGTAASSSNVPPTAIQILKRPKVKDASTAGLLDTVAPNAIPYKVDEDFPAGEPGDGEETDQEESVGSGAQQSSYYHDTAGPGEGNVTMVPGYTFCIPFPNFNGWTEEPQIVTDTHGRSWSVQAIPWVVDPSGGAGQAEYPPHHDSSELRGGYVPEGIRHKELNEQHNASVVIESDWGYRDREQSGTSVSQTADYLRALPRDLRPSTVRTKRLSL